VSGGVAPPRLAALGPTGREIWSCELPAHAEVGESFEAVSARRVNMNGALVDIPRGFRYAVKVKMAYLTLAEWRELAAAFTLWRAGFGLRFWPHADCEAIRYDVVPAADFSFPYVAGKYLGYAGTLELTGTALLPYIPAAARYSYFCAAGTTGYAPDEITHFTAAAEEHYAPAETSHFSPARGMG